MSLYRPIPPLTLAANVEAPLSPTSWRDYGKLLYWIFFFPQAIRDYVTPKPVTTPPPAAPAAAQSDQAQTTIDPAAAKAVAEQAAQVANPQKQTPLVSMSAILLPLLTGLIALLTGAGQRWLGDLDWRVLVNSGLGSVPLGLLIAGLVFQVNRWKNRPAHGVVLGVASGVTTTLISMFVLGEFLDDHFLGMGRALGYGFLSGSGVGIVNNLAMTLAPGGQSKPSLRPGLIGALVSGLVIFIINGVHASDRFFDLNISQENWLAVISGMLTFLGGAQLGQRRPLDWLLHAYQVGRQLERNPSQLTPPHVTTIPLRKLQSSLESWLAANWDGGLKNADQLWSYSCQFTQITNALHEVLASLPAEQQVASVVRFVDAKNEQDRGYPWLMILYQKRRKSKTVINLQNQPKSTEPTDTSKYIQERRDEIRYRLVAKEARPLYPLDNAAQAAVAGFWYLTNKFMTEGATAFSFLPDDELSKELQALANAFCILLYKENLLNEPRVEIVGRPKEPKRKPTWDAIDDFKSVIRYGWLYKQSNEESKRKTVMELALQKLNEIAQKDKIARPDRLAIIAIIKIWIEDLQKWQNTLHKAQKMKPCTPYICFEPIRTQSPFVGRDGLSKQLRQAWTQGTRQPVLLYGLTQTGKTSLVERARDTHKEYAEVVLIHLAVVRKSSSLTNRILWTLYQAVLDKRGYVPFRESDFLKDPFAITERAIRNVCSELNRMLVLVIDEFDLAYRSNQPTRSVTDSGDLIPSVPATEKLLEFWWHLYRSIHNLTFVFVIQSPIDDFPKSAFREHLWQLRVGNLDEEAVGKVLTKPNPDFSPLFTPEAVDHLFMLTHGQPYLVQLLAHLTMQRFNSALTKDPQPSPVFDPDDVNKVLEDVQYKQFIEHHSTRILRQLNTAHAGCEQVLRTIAQHQGGLTKAELANYLAGRFTEQELEIILNTLRNGEVVKTIEERQQVAVELLRRAVTMQ